MCQTHQVIAASFALVVSLLVGSATADAFPYSRNNPFASYNVHGTNYGSQQWEKAYGRRSQRNLAPRRPRNSASTRLRRSW